MQQDNSRVRKALVWLKKKTKKGNSSKTRRGVFGTFLLAGGGQVGRGSFQVEKKNNSNDWNGSAGGDAVEVLEGIGAGCRGCSTGESEADINTQGKLGNASGEDSVLSTMS